jgi:hypothetical protein
VLILKAGFFIALIAILMPHGNVADAGHPAIDRSQSPPASLEVTTFMTSAWDVFAGHGPNQTTDEYLAGLRTRLEVVRSDIEDQQRSRQRMHPVGDRLL